MHIPPQFGHIPSGNTMELPLDPVWQSDRSFASSRLRRHGDFQRAYAAGRKRQSASMSWFLAPQPSDASVSGGSRRTTSTRIAGPRVGLTVGKVLGKAHERNRIKRRMRAVLRRHLELLPEGTDLILHPRRVVLTMEYTKLEAEMVRILTQARAEAARMLAQPPPRAAKDVSAC
jgi:ribonuclease P protein component